ncbi:MAG: ACR3 family arsenite efflux transporter [Thiocapsa sp.]|nr:MAG: ACR3 family arsenite efflux transporter [Thiocapsa sp.]
MTSQCEVAGKQAAGADMGLFERYLSVWVALCILAGIGLGHVASGAFQTIGELEVAQINLPVAVLIWLMIIPMLLKVDLTALSGVTAHWRGSVVTLVVNWAIKPFSMALLAWLFIGWWFAPYLPADQIDSYIAGMIILGAAPCTAMVFVWSNLSRGEPNFTLAQVALNDLIMVIAFGPIVALLLGLTAIMVPWETLLLSVLLYIVVPLVIATIWRRLLLRADPRGGALARVLGRLHPVSLLALLATLVLLFGFQGEQITAQPLIIGLLAVPLLIQSALIFVIAYLANRWVRSPHCIAGPSAMIGTSNFFELAVATAIALFGFQSGAALATVVGVLIEVPVMLLLVRVVLRTRRWYERGRGIPPSTDLVPLAAAATPSGSASGMLLSPRASDGSVRWVQGQVVANRIAELTAPVGGRLLACNVYEGDAVEADQELLRIAPTVGAAAAASGDRGREAQPETTDAIHDTVAAEALVLRAPWQALVRRVHAPIEGRLVEPRGLLIELIATDGIALRFAVEERDAMALRPGDRVQVHFGIGGASVDASTEASGVELQIERAWPELDPDTRTRRFEARLPPDLSPVVGLSAQVRITVA